MGHCALHSFYAKLSTKVASLGTGIPHTHTRMQHQHCRFDLVSPPVPGRLVVCTFRFPCCHMGHGSLHYASGDVQTLVVDAELSCEPPRVAEMETLCTPLLGCLGHVLSVFCCCNGLLSMVWEVRRKDRGLDDFHWRPPKRTTFNGGQWKTSGGRWSAEAATLSVCWQGAGRGLCRHPHALPPSRLSLSGGLRSSPLQPARSFAASLLSLPLTGTANVDGELPPLSDILADSPSRSPLASRVAWREYALRAPPLLLFAIDCCLGFELRVAMDVGKKVREKKPIKTRAQTNGTYDATMSSKTKSEGALRPF